MRSVVVGGPGLVAVGIEHSGSYTDPTYWNTTDVSSWRRVQDRRLGGPGEQNLATVVSGGPGLVAGGRAGTGSDVDAGVWTSADGVTWTPAPRASLGGAGVQEIRLIVQAGRLLVAVGMDQSTGSADAAVWTSTDGTAWDRVQSAAFGGDGVQTMWGAATIGGRLVTVGWSGPDGGFDAAVWTADVS
jgi:hypothetical protein